MFDPNPSYPLSILLKKLASVGSPLIKPMISKAQAHGTRFFLSGASEALAGGQSMHDGIPRAVIGTTLKDKCKPSRIKLSIQRNLR